MNAVVRFDDARAGVHELVGGKAANLGRLTAAGFPVPAGYTVTTEAHAAFWAAAALGERTAGLLRDVPADDVAALERATEEVRTLIVAQTMPADIAEEIAAEYRALGGDAFVAVRSSGVA